MTFQEDYPGMAIDLQTLRDEPAVPDDLEIARVEDAGGLARFDRAFTVAGDAEAAIEPGLLQLLARSGYGDSDQWTHYLGTLDGAAVATTSVFAGAGAAGIYLVATVPALRRRGIATALVFEALRRARNAGYTIGTLQTSSEGMGLYRALGFREYCRFAFYVRELLR
jgi:ribosomal protein S18 acetylase RimI-like enzyme